MGILSSALLLPASGMVSLIGGGGKTTLLYALGKELAQEGKRVILTTSTHIGRPSPGQASVLLLNPSPASLQAALEGGGPVCCANPTDSPKLTSPEESFFDWCRPMADYILVEADGAKRLPFKAPALHEPALPRGTDLVIGVAGMEAAGKPIRDCCHRPNLVSGILGCSQDALLSPEGMAAVLLSQNGYQKKVPSAGLFRLVLNQCDSKQAFARGQAVLSALRRQGAAFPILLAALNTGCPIRSRSVI